MDERERETELEIERLHHDGRVFHWSTKRPGRPGATSGGGSGGGSSRASGWPGHTTFVALRGGEVVLGDRYAGEGVERTYTCDPASLLEGCFQELVAEQLGPRVLEELLAEVRRELGVAAQPGGGGSSSKEAREPKAAASPATTAASPAGTPSAPEAATMPSKAAKAASGAAAPASTPAAAKVVSAPAKPGPASVVASERSSAAPATPAVAATSTVSSSAQPGPALAAARVDLTVIACRSVSLPLAVALRGITRASVHELLGRLRSLPCRVAAGVPREQAEGLAARLAELGAEVRLVPADAS